MQETELKFQVPAARSAALRRAVGTASAQTTHLQAVYVDTAALDLARAGLALRLRKEGPVWVQTLKGRGDGLIQRLEHEVRLPPQRGIPQIDLQRHAGTPAAAALAAALPDGAALQPLYRTDIRRLHRRVRFQGAVIEIAHDVGALHADGRSAPVDEIEFELVSGPPLALAQLVQRWVARHGVWWDCRTKSERGTRLALQRHQVPATGSVAASWPATAQPADVWAATVQAALAQALPNAAEIASGQGTPEHLHQLRVALRRLRSVLRVLAPWSGQPETALALEAEWRPIFGSLGAARDADVWDADLAPQLRAADAPDWAPPAGTAGPLPANIVVGAAFNALLLRTLALTLSSAEAPSRPAHPKFSAHPERPAKRANPELPVPAELSAAVQQLLRAPWRAARRGVKQFDGAAPVAQHRTRRQLKRLRYALEALQPLFQPKPHEQLMRALRRALATLGKLNDLQVAAASCRAQAAADPRAWFAAGWLVAQTAPAHTQAVRALAKLAKAPGLKVLRAT